MKRKRLIGLLPLLFLTSCLQMKEMENLGIVTARGIDLAEDSKIETSLVFFQFETQGSETARLVYGTGNTLTGAMDDANDKTNFLLAPGKIELELYGMPLVEKGIREMLDSIGRDPKIPYTLYMAISDSTAKNLMNLQESGIYSNIGLYLHDLIDENTEQEIFPKVTLVKFSRLLHDVGQDPILPVLNIVNDTPKLTSIAIFKDDKVVGKVPFDDSLLFNLLEKTIRGVWIETTFPIDPFKPYISGKPTDDNLSAAFEILKGKGKTKLINKEKLQFETTIDMQLGLLETTESLMLDDIKTVKFLEREYEKKLESRYKKLLSHLKELGADSIGYGSVYRMHKTDGKLTNKEWYEQYPDIEVTFNINVDIIRHGETN